MKVHISNSQQKHISPTQQSHLFCFVFYILRFYCMLSFSVGKGIKADTVWVIKGVEENTLLTTLRNRIMIFWYEAHTQWESDTLLQILMVQCKFENVYKSFLTQSGRITLLSCPRLILILFMTHREKTGLLLIFIVCYLERPRFAGCSGSFWDFNTSRNESGQAVFITTGRKTGTTGGFNQLRSD